MFCGAKKYNIAKICALAAIAAAALFSPLRAQEPFPQLPPNESGLAELLEEGVIDSVQYGQLLAFYALPLSVPRGELGYLALAFPEIAEALPATPEELAEYEPYGSREVRRLFSDYPALCGFEPVLRFNAAEPRSAGEAAVGFNRSRASALSGHRARFRWAGGALSAEGAASLSDSAALWHTRRVAASRKGVTAQIGNFKQRMPLSLALGAFAPPAPPPGAPDGAPGGFIAENWLYGGNAAWNGAAFDAREIPGAKAVGASAFCHLRPNEIGWGAGADAKFGKRASLSAGLAAFNARAFALLSAGYRANGLAAQTEAAAPLSGENRAPALSIRLNHRAKNAAAEYEFTAYPANFDAPNSRLKKQLLAETGEKDTAAPIRKHAFKTTVPMAGGAAKLIHGLEFTECGGAKRIRAGAEAAARAGGADISVKHASKIFPNGAGRALHASSAAVIYRPERPVGIQAKFQSAYGGGKKTKFACSAEIPVAAIPNALLTPYAMGKYGAAKEHWLGIKGEFRLYKKTWTAASVEAPVNAKGEGDVYVKVASSYSF
jgi:hypothetical protein